MCNCTRLSFCIGNIVYIFERLASCCAATSVVTCIVTTMLIMLGVGIGLGYNYCYVDVESGRNKEDDLNTPFPPVYSHVTTSKSQSIVQNSTISSTTNSSVTENPKRRTPSAVHVDSTMIAPLFVGIDFNYLIQKIKEKRQNVTLELIA